MYLKRLEISGFKSFAKHTALEFPTPISAIVGPNGSGKSNVAEAIRWVLGEQSIKSLRGKRGEDLIFSGSHATPRLSKASVSLIFDNTQKEFPLEFEEVSVGRRVYRDGANDYLLNGSQVRLRDIIELLANVGFGSSQHHIIGQGESDRILYASLAKRREMIEDALGLKIFQIKRLEAERKLERTEENMKQVEALRREIQPHLKFLKSQSEKFEIVSKLREDLKKNLEGYLSRKSATIQSNRSELEEKKSAPVRELKKIESEVSSIRNKIEKIEKTERGTMREDKDLEEKLDLLREARLKTEYDLGRLEGMIELEEKNLREMKEVVISKKEIETLLSDVSRRLEELEKETVLEKLISKIGVLRKVVADFLKGLKGEKLSREENLGEYKVKLGELKTGLSDLKKEENELSRTYEEKMARTRKEAEESRREEKQVYELEREAGGLKDILRSFELEGEKIRLAQEELRRELEEARPYLGGDSLPKGDVFSSSEEAEMLRRKVERTKIKLEEAGGIDPAILKEYKEVSVRDEFFGRELGDLIKSAESLRHVMKELEERLEHDFTGGLSKINAEFQRFFEMMFGGGKASLKLQSRSQRKRAREENEEFAREEEEEEGGIDISVDLPRKRIKSLDMLSGGERALTSIALLFALSTVHPPPFLVLDETDAALDEANSQRYAAILEGLAQTTQLIVITHNRETMKRAGILYGITMGSDGISKLLSLKFEEAGALVG